MKQHLFEQRHNADWQRFETRHGQVVQVCDVSHEPAVDQLPDQHLAQVVDIHGEASRVVEQ